MHPTAFIVPNAGGEIEDRFHIAKYNFQRLGVFFVVIIIPPFFALNTINDFLISCPMCLDQIEKRRSESLGVFELLKPKNTE
jgi:hypothetical protein